jgi:hypothetical protein
MQLTSFQTTEKKSKEGRKMSWSGSENEQQSKNNKQIIGDALTPSICKSQMEEVVEAIPPEDLGGHVASAIMTELLVRHHVFLCGDRHAFHAQPAHVALQGEDRRQGTRAEMVRFERR